MRRLDFTLLTDGSSDAVLVHPLTWLLEQNLQHLSVAVIGTWADLRRLPTPPKDLAGRVAAALDLYPCDILFVHRDAEAMPFDQRVDEIDNAVAQIANPHVPVVPIRMQEAWLLFDEPALRRAAGNPSGRVNLQMPAVNQLESIPDPKQLLHALLLEAGELTGRRRKKQRPSQQALRLGEIIQDYGVLRQLAAFRRTEERLLAILEGDLDY
ncbi:MAG: hypothetical protein KDJ27_13460 [Gammaproteobacteria bacterium]|nr:hypothetical protein [Gammaproteobacteria bacterium]